MDCDTGNVFTRIIAEGPERIWLEQLTSFYDPSADTYIKFLNEDNEIYTGLAQLLGQKFQEYFGQEINNPSQANIPYQAVLDSIPVDYLNGISLRPYQISIAARAIFHGRGTLELATGSGKTEIAAILIRWLFNAGLINTGMVMTESVFLMEQFYSRIKKRLNVLTCDEIGILVDVLVSMYRPGEDRLIAHIKEDHSLGTLNLRTILTTIYERLEESQKSEDLSRYLALLTSFKPSLPSVLSSYHPTINNLITIINASACDPSPAETMRKEFERSSYHTSDILYALIRDVDLVLGRLGDNNKELNANLIVGVGDSWYAGMKRSADPTIARFVHATELLVVDESHHLRSRSWRGVASRTDEAKYRIGLTPAAFEDPNQLDPDDYHVVGLTGPVIARLPASWLSSRGFLATQHISVLYVSEPKVKSTTWQTAYRKGIILHPDRNKLVLQITAGMYRSGMKILILVQQLEHGWRLLTSLYKMGLHAIFARGGKQVDSVHDGNPKTETIDIDTLNSQLNNMDRFILIGSGGVLDEGVDLPYINCVILASGYKKHRRILQRLGRGMRPKAGDNMVYTFDFYDAHNKILERHSRSRIGTYQYEQHAYHPGLDDIRSRGFEFDLVAEVPWDDGWVDGFSGMLKGN